MSLSDVLDVLVPGGFILLVLALIFIKNPSPGRDEVAGFEPGASVRAAIPAQVPLPTRLAEGRHDKSRPAPVSRSLPGGPVLPERDRILDDGQLRHGFEWRERERELRGDA